MVTPKVFLDPDPDIDCDFCPDTLLPWFEPGPFLGLLLRGSAFSYVKIGKDRYSSIDYRNYHGVAKALTTVEYWWDPFLELCHRLCRRRLCRPIKSPVTLRPIWCWMGVATP